MKTFAIWCESQCLNPRKVAKDNPKFRCYHCGNEHPIGSAMVTDFGKLVCKKCAKTYEVPDHILYSFR